MDLSSIEQGRPPRELCRDWGEITGAFDSFPHERLGYDSLGELGETLWVFRGHKSTKYPLRPSIERDAAKKPFSWAALELKVLEEFQSRARMHLNSSDVPQQDDRLSWLALMQHYGVPTRLLDFTLSPYVALYFALRNRTREELAESIEVWAIDAHALMEIAKKRERDAYKQEYEYFQKNSGTTISLVTKTAILDPRFFSTDRDVLQGENKSRAEMLSAALSAAGIRRAHFNENGFVALAMPPIHNRRLSSQQGAFLFSGAEDLNFEDSLFKMMDGTKPEWCRRFEVPGGALQGIERQLFQRNIHELSLFPDMEGLAGFIRQKARLHWVPDDCCLLSPLPDS
jgi:hypothetical protein